MPGPEAALLAQFETEAPVRRVDGYLVIDKCRPHACPSDAAIIVVDLALAASSLPAGPKQSLRASGDAAYFDEIRSTSNTSVAFGGITPPAPRAP